MNTTATAATPATAPKSTPADLAAFFEFVPFMPLASIVASKTNPRQRFDPVALEELAASIKARGLVHPILVRPLAAGKFEVVAGERRLRASKLAGRTDIRATVQKLDDLAVAELQLIENEQREDINPLEEAIGFNNLIQQVNPATGKNHTKEDLAKKIGKSTRHIFNRLSLLHLCPEAKAALLDGKLPPSQALTLATLGHHNTQRAALKDLITPDHHGDLLSARAAAAHVQRRFMLDLKAPGFDTKLDGYKNDKGILIAGPCNTCPKRSGNNPDLFGNVEGANVCTDITCFDAKKKAATVINIAALEKAGRKVITGADAEKIFPAHYRGNGTESGYTKPDQAIYDVPANSPAYGKTFAKLLGKDLPSQAVLNPFHNTVEEVVDRAAAMRLIRKKGLAPSSSTGNSNPRGADAKAKEKLELAQGNAIIASLFSATRAAFKGKLDRSALEGIARALYHDCDNPLIGHAWSNAPLASDQAAEQHMQLVANNMDKASEDELRRMIFDMLLLNGVHPARVSHIKTEFIYQAAAAAALDPDAIITEAKAAVKKAVAPAPKAKPAKKAKPAPAAKKPAAKAKPAPKAAAKAKPAPKPKAAKKGGGK